MKKFLVSVSILFVFCLAFVLNGCGTNNASNKGDPVVPTYQGMTISKESTTAISNMAYSSPYMSSPIRLMSSSMNSDEISATDEHLEHDETLENDIEDIVTIDVNTDDEVKYYVQPNETFIIQVHISNPYDYEIQSFTLNGKKYANYMFKDGSTMELLLLEVTAPSTSGYIEYSIDAIKYIDGTEIKDVDMSTGDKSIKAGIAYTEAPTAQILSQNISTTSFTVGINIFDRNSLIGSNELSIYLSDGQEVLAKKDLKVGENTITFDNLTMSTTYEYGIVTAYDLIDGRDVHSEWLFTNRITTLGAFSFNNVKANKTSISFEINRTGEVGTIKSISLYDANTKELINSGDSSIRVFENLLSSHTYNLYADFVYTINGEEVSDYTCVKSITTEAKVKPTLSFDNVSADKTSIGYTITATDTDGILNVTKVELLKNTDSVKDNGTTLSGTFTGLLSNNEYSVRVSYTYDLNDGQGAIAGFISKSITTEAKVKPTLSFENVSITDTTISESFTKNDSDNTGTIDNVKLYKENELQQINSSKLINFTGLEYYTDYKVVIEFSYNLNDGNGLINDTCERTYKTSPHLVFNTCKIINTSAVSEGDTIYLQVSLDNPSGALPTSVDVNGCTYRCTGSTTANKIYVEIINNGQFVGGDTVLTVDKVTVTKDNENYTIVPISNNYDNVFINGANTILNVEYVNSSFETINWCFPNDEVYIMVTFDNPTGYSIDTINEKSNEWTRIDDNHYYASATLSKGWNNYSVFSCEYSNAYISKEMIISGIRCDCYQVAGNDIKYISSYEDLLNMGGGYYYEQIADIDLAGISWEGNCFNGVFNGNDYKISNMSVVDTISNKNLSLGLFSNGTGIISNVIMSDILYLVTLNSTGDMSYDINYGSIFSRVSNTLYMKECHVVGDSIVSLTNATSDGEIHCGGLMGYVDYGGTCYRVESCSNNSLITINAKTPYPNEVYVGGLIGGTAQTIKIDILESYNIGAVNVNNELENAETAVGGLIGYTDANIYIVNSYNAANIVGTSSRTTTFGASTFTGGIIGSYAYRKCTLINVYNIGEINTQDKNIVGDIFCGFEQMNMQNCINFVGGLSEIYYYDSSSTSSFINCYSNFNKNYNVVVLSPDLLKDFFVNTLLWDDTIWDFSEMDIENGKYPVLKDSTK